MRKLAIYTLLALAALMSGCAKNNGDIGLWFGLWHLDTIEVDGEPDAAYNGCYYFLFQGKVFNLNQVDEAMHSYDSRVAQWSESDDGSTITIDFADDRYTPYFGNGYPSVYLSTVTTLRVLKLTTTTMVLEHEEQSTGSTITYHLTRWD